MDHESGDDPYRPGQVDITEPANTAEKTLLVVVLVVLVIDLYLLMGVVPKFGKMFDALGGQLPQVTVLVLFVSHFLQDWGLVLFVAVAVGGWFAYRKKLRIPLMVSIPTVVVLGVTMLCIPIAIFYPILELQSAVRGDQPAAQPVEHR